uniref:Uncharacterized protein n=1 Tax=Oryza sativa subsp. japonica TaxID=39947 RepID=Q69MP2_ORYSJ|nr:hypothetical protein [Oryza sativa Japonica Group]
MASVPEALGARIKTGLRRSSLMWEKRSLPSRRCLVNQAPGGGKNGGGGGSRRWRRKRWR